MSPEEAIDAGVPERLAKDAKDGGESPVYMERGRKTHESCNGNRGLVFRPLTPGAQMSGKRRDHTKSENEAVEFTLDTSVVDQ